MPAINANRHPPRVPRTVLITVCAALPALALGAGPPLPVPSAAFVSSGRVAAPVINQQVMTVRQQSPKATLDWQSFNIGAGYTVEFKQPSESAIALNLIRQQSPSRIDGALRANGEVWLLNDNGIVFGNGAAVNVRGLIASSLAPTDNSLAAGLAPPNAQAYDAPTFSGEASAGEIRVAAGASLETNGANGRIFLFGPKVTNEGLVVARDGQVGLAAGTEIYLRQPGAAAGSGLVIEVGNGGVVTNGSDVNAGEKDPSALLGQIVADRGTATLVGLSVNQQGRVSANSAVKSGGTIRLLARNVSPVPGTALLTALDGGVVTLGANSVTQANPDPTDTTTVVDASPALHGKVEMLGKHVLLGRDSLVEAKGGEIKAKVNDQGNDGLLVQDAPSDSESRIVMQAGSRLDASGADATADAARNLLTVKLQGAELKDRPVQRDGVLRGATITVDLRKTGKLADGTPWVGTPLADLTGSAAAELKRSNAERNSVGGTVTLEAQGGIFLDQGSSIDVSGGVVHYGPGPAKSSLLIRDGRVTPIADANPELRYDGLYGDYTLTDFKWGGTDTWSIVSGTGDDGLSSPYDEGKDAGSIRLNAPRLALGGNLLGSAAAGVLQQKPTDLALANGLARPVDQLPRRGQLVVGSAKPASERDPQFITPDVTLAALSSGKLDQAVLDPDKSINRLGRRVGLDTRQFGAAGLGELVVYSEGTVSVPTGSSLDLGPAGRFTVQAGRIEVDGSISAPAGSIDLLALDTSEPEWLQPSTGDLHLGPHARLDVSGLWSNEANVLREGLQPAPPRLPDGGSLRLVAQGKEEGVGALRLDPGSSLRADGGGVMGSKGKFTDGAGGSITLGARPDPFGIRFDVPFEFGSTVSAFGFQQGGVLTLNARSFCIGDACGAPATGRVDLRPGFFSEGGFSRFELTASGGAIDVLPGTVVPLTQRNWMPSNNLLAQPTGSLVRNFTVAGTLEPSQRRPVDLKLTLKGETPLNQFDDATLQGLGGLTLGAGSALLGEPGAAITLSSDTRLLLDGRIVAPGGRIDASLTSGLGGSKLLQFLASQTLWVGPRAVLDARGTFAPKPDSKGLLSGKLLAGGSINLNAASGTLVAERGSRLDVSGTRAALDITPLGRATAFPERTLIASDGGSISLGAAEGLLLEAHLAGTAGAPGARDGSLKIELDAQRRNDSIELSIDALGLPVGSRVLNVYGEPVAAVPRGLRPGLPVPPSLNGIGKVSVADIAEGGFGDIVLRARNYQRGTGEAPAPGRIVFHAPTTLAATRRLTLDASSLEADGDLRLVAPYLAIGAQDSDANAAAQRTPDAPARGAAQLQANAQWIDLVGRFQLSGFERAVFRAEDDLRFRGVQLVNRPQGELSTAGEGQLLTAADLVFAARRAYPTTLTDFSIDLQSTPRGEVRFEQVGSRAGTPLLSAGGSLTVNAPRIVQQGSLLAPMGNLDLNAGQHLLLDKDSLTSTALTDAVVPFGRIELGKDWVYALDTVSTTQARLVFTPQSNRAADDFPKAGLRLAGPDVQFAEGAVINQSGGGDLRAYEFQPGLQGSRDPLVGNASFAVIPGLGAELAPIDPQEQQGFALRPGDTVELASGVAGLPAGRYSLLPAHYALLPGAFLVTPVSGYADLLPDVRFELPGQGTVVAGRRVFLDGQQGDQRNTGFLLRGATDLARLGRFDVASANTFVGLADQNRPVDAGTLRIEATDSVSLRGELRARPAAGGRSARVEIGGTDLQIVAAAASGAGRGLQLRADDLNALGAASLLLGGSLSGTGAEQRLAVTAGRVEVGEGVRLEAPELLLAATDTLRVDAGARLVARGDGGAGVDEILLEGEGALLRLATGSPVSVRRNADGGEESGNFELAAGAALVAPGATLIDVTGDAQLDGLLVLQGDLQLAAPRISLGSASGDVRGIALADSLLSALPLDTLTLQANEGVEVFGGLDLSLNDLRIDTPTLTGHPGDGSDVSLAAKKVSLGNSLGLAPAPIPMTDQGGGALRVVADELRFADTADGAFAFKGFDLVELAASGELRGEGRSRLTVPGALSLTGSAVTVAGGGLLDLSAGGALQLSLPSEPVVIPAATDLGGRIKLTASELAVGLPLLARAGRIDLHAVGSGGGITLTPGATLDVSAVAVDFAGQESPSPAGTIGLVSDSGNLVIEAGSKLDLSGGDGGGPAGALQLAAPGGLISVAESDVAFANRGAAPASAEIDVGSTADRASLPQLLSRLSDAGFNQTLAARLRQGDLQIAGGTSLRAHNLGLAVDAGQLEIAGTLDASGASGGTIELAASDVIAVTRSGRLDVHGIAGPGGRVSLSTGAAGDGSVATGGIDLARGSVVDASGKTGGQVHLRLPQASVLAGGEALRLDGTILGSAETVLEGFRAYTDDHLTAAETQVDNNPRYDDAAAFMAQADALKRALGAVAAGSTFHVRPGVEIRNNGADAGDALALDAVWDLSTWRFGTEPGVLTLRAGGDLLVNDILSDGFAGTADLALSADGVSLRCVDAADCAARPVAQPTLLSEPSWSYLLVAGADFSAADPRRVTNFYNRGDGDIHRGDLWVAGGTPSVPNTRPGAAESPVLRPILNAIRTGTGRIDIRTSGDLTLANRAAVIYTAGVASPQGVRLGSPDLAARSTLGGRPYPVDGGAISIAAGGDLNGVDPGLSFESDSSAFPRQLPSSWLFRQGNIDAQQRATGWTVAPEWFEAGIGALGGGDVALQAAGSLNNLSVATASSGMQVGGETAAASAVTELGGGVLEVRAGEDIRGGVFHVGRGSAALEAGGSFTSGHAVSPASATPLLPVLSIGDASFSLRATGAIALGGAVNPTFIPQGPFQKQQARGRDQNSYFLTYSERSRLALAATNGNITLGDATALESGAFETDFRLGPDTITLRVLPPKLEATAFRGDIDLKGDFTLLPAASGNLQLLAGNNILLRRAVVLSDAEASGLPDVDSPQAFSLSEPVNVLRAALSPQTPAAALAETPNHLTPDGQRARVVARNGDIESDAAALLFLSRPAEVIAGRDLINPHLVIENLRPDDVSVVQAGRDLRYESPRVPKDSRIGAPGALIGANNAINVWGPGRLVAEAGRDVDLGTAGGILSRGATVNPALLGEGAAISVLAGLGTAGLQPAGFIEAYFGDDSPYLPQLLVTVRALTGDEGLSAAQAREQFLQLPRSEQLGTVFDAFFAELRANGRAAAASRAQDYTRGDKAISALLPRKDYVGDLDLYFSQIFTLAGGNIDLMVPGGNINVGLATPPSTFGISKQPAQLGVVTEGLGDVRAYLQGNFDVNESRVFAADGGDILVWSNLGDIDAGRGARSALSVPANGFQFDREGRVTVSVPPPIQGSGIRALTTTPGRAFGSVDLVTPRGVVNASEAGIESAGNITIAAVEVLGAENIKAGGASVGVPVANIGAIGASVSGAAGAANAASKAASDSAAGATRDGAGGSTVGSSDVPIISVEFLGFGDS